MDKTPQKVTKDPKRQEAAQKGRENYMNKLKESILNDAKKGREDISNASSEANDATNSATTSATGATTKSSDTYIGIVYILAIVVGIVAFLPFLGHNKKSSQAANKEQANEEQQQPIKPPKRRNML